MSNGYRKWILLILVCVCASPTRDCHELQVYKTGLSGSYPLDHENVELHRKGQETIIHAYGMSSFLVQPTIRGSLNSEDEVLAPLGSQMNWSL